MAKPKEETLILIADPDEKSLQIIPILLHKLGYVNILEAKDRETAETTIKTKSRSNTGMSGLLGGAAPKETTDIDLIMIDADLAPFGGVRMVADLRKRFGDEKPAIIFTTKEGKDDIFASALQAGANDVIAKPFSKDMLGIKLNVLLGADKPPKIRSFSFTPAPKPAPAQAKPKKEEPAPAKAAQAPSAVRVNGPASTPPSTGGVSFQSRGAGKKTYSTDGEPTAVLVNGKIDGHYHEQVNVIGGGQNCYWARRVGEQEKVRLEYLSAKGTPTGMEAKVIPLTEFMYTFVLCDESNCHIMERLAGERK
ncbi:MAG: response regulator [Nitrospinae bacterium]|nr:response regulator [Nitrospinota bacterium]